MNSDILETIRQRGLWRVLVRPTAYRERLLDRLQDVEKAIRACVVQIRGWDYPHWETPARLQDSVDASVDWQHHKEYWRAYRSGQFVHEFAMWEDWYADNQPPHRIEVAPGAALSYGSTIYHFAEIFLFAGRWAARCSLTPRVRIELDITHLAGRELQTMDPNRVPFHGRIAEAPRYHFEREYEPEELIGGATDLAIPPLIELFELFHWDETEAHLRDQIAKALARRL